MTAEEFELAKRIAEELPLPLAPVRRRRHEASGRGRIDLRKTMLAMARQPATLLPRFSEPRTELPTLVVLLDISGSMDRYARLMLHYVHGLTRRHLKVHTLTFGTRLTNITRALRNRDPDVALAIAAAQVQDWKGGTRIASCLDDFNRHWARRLLGANAAVLLVSDGLDTDEHGDLSRAARQLRLYAHQIVWLNPLLRFDRFEPRAAGIRAILRTSTASCRCTTWPASPTSRSPCVRHGYRSLRSSRPRRPAARPNRIHSWNCTATDSFPHPSPPPGRHSTIPRR
jgi:uncharacterized protein with von Willebrand factor type A (vWA) domain